MSEIRAHLIKGVRTARVSDDQKVGLFGFERENLDSSGSKEISLAVPVAQLPMAAIAAIRAIPQPESLTGKHPPVFDTEMVQFGLVLLAS